jgi:hypothetical protein
VNATEVLGQKIFTGRGYKRFGDFTHEDVQSRAAELAAAATAGPLARVAPVARAWRELGVALRSAGVDTVAELDPELVCDLGRRTWVLPPSLLK